MTPPRIVKIGTAGYDIGIGRCATAKQSSAPPDVWRYGNPFVIGLDGGRSEVVRKYEVWLRTGETFDCALATEERRQWILDHLHELEGKTLGCFCDVENGQKCHGSVLAALLVESGGERK
jgi:hypothetical protein